MTRLTSAALVVTVTVLGGLLIEGMADAAVPPGTLTITPSSGTDQTVAVTRTSAGCPADSTGYDLEIAGPIGVATDQQVFNPAVLVTSTSDVGLSTTSPFDIPFELSFRNLSRGKPLIAGDYSLTAKCLDAVTLEVHGTFTTSVTFTDPTHWHSNSPTVTVTKTTTSTTLYVTPGTAGFVPISGSGSGSEVLDTWRRDFADLEGLAVNFSANGSGTGHDDFAAGQADFAVSGIPYDRSDGGVLDLKPARAFGYLPILAGAPAFMYNLTIDNKRVTNLRLSGETLTKIFTQQITNWSDPAIKADNPGLALPQRAIVPVVRSDGADTTAAFTAWMASQYPTLWDDYCNRAGRNITPCGFTSYYPLTDRSHAQAGSQGVAGFVAQPSSEGAITYVDYANARNVGFPVAKVLNKANYYVEPTASNVAVALLKAKIKSSDLTADLSQVYANPDPRAYPLSSYSYMIIPKDTAANFTTHKGRTLSEFAYYSLCQGQQQAKALGSAPLPINLVKAGVAQVGQIPGSTHKLSPTDLRTCNNPTISPDGTDLLADNTPLPEPCDLKGAPTQCTTSTGGAGGAAPATSTASPGATSPVGAAVTLTAVVAPSTATGSVQVTEGTTDIGNPVTVTNGVASMTTSKLAVGSHQLIAVFTPTDQVRFHSSTSNTVTFVVNAPIGARITTTTTLTMFRNRAFEGIPVGFLAKVAPGGAAGTVQFMDGTSALGAPVPVTHGLALLITALPRGSHSLTAVFIPADPTALAPSTSAPVSATVNPLFSSPGSR